MKASLHTFLIFFIVNNAFSQGNDLKTHYPFDLSTLTESSTKLLLNDSIAPVYSRDGFIYINTFSKKLIINQKFETAYPFVWNFALVKMHGKYGVINRRGVFVVQPVYKSFNLYLDFNQGIYFDKDGFFSFNTGKLIKAYSVGCGEPYFEPFEKFKRGSKFGLIYNADTIRRPIYDSVYVITNGIAIVKQAGKIGVIGRDGSEFLGFNYDEYGGYTYNYNTLVFVLKQSGIWDYYDKKIKLFESRYQPELSGGIFLVKHNGLYNYLDKKGNLVLSKDFKWISKYGSLAINQNNNVVFLLKGVRELKYYSPAFLSVFT